MAIIPVLTKNGKPETSTASTSSRIIPVLTKTPVKTTKVTPTVKSASIQAPKPTIRPVIQPPPKTPQSIFSTIQKAAQNALKAGGNAREKLSNKNLGKTEGVGATIGRALQKVPNADLGTKGQKFFQATDTETKIVNFISNIPSMIAQTTGWDLEMFSTPQGKVQLKEGTKNLPKTMNQVKSHIQKGEWQKAVEVAFANPAFAVGLDLAGFIPGGAILKGVRGGLRGSVASKAAAQAAIKEALEESAIKIPKETVKRADDYIAKFGNVVDSDRAKELLPGYTKEKAPEFHKASQEIRDEVYTRLLETNKGKGDNTVYFTAGGAASGKSESLVRGSAKGHAIAYDTTLSSPARVADLRKAIDNGYDVHVDFTASDPVAAWDRVQKRGRQIPLESFVRDYEQSLENVKKLYVEFKDNPNVNFGFRDNRGAMGEAKVVSFDEINKIEYNREQILKEINETQNRQKETGSTNNQRSNRGNESGNEAQVSPGKEVVPQKVAVPRQQLPVGKGVEKASRLEARVTESLDKTPQEIKDQLGSTYTQMSKKENIQKAVKYVNENPEDAMAILRGEKEAPKDILKNSIYVAMENQAVGDTALARKLASLQSTRAGQELSILTEIDPDSPVRLMRDIVKVREEAFKRRYGGRSAQEVSKKVVADIQKQVKTPSKYDWNTFVNSIQC